jgi:hypothetical protein
MGDKRNKFDEVFRKSLSNHIVIPKPEIWDRLSEKLDKKEKAIAFIWWKWAAAAAVMVLSFSLMYPSKHQETKNMVTNSPEKMKSMEEVPVAPQAIQRRQESEELPKIAQQLSTGKSKENSSNQPGKRKSAPKSFKVEEDVLTLDREPETLPPALENVSHDLDNLLMKTQIDKHNFPPNIALTEAKLTTEKEYKVRIISNGYAIRPEKERLVETLENRIGGFFSKLDEGFGDLQDAKNNLFASLTTKRDKKNN